MLLFCYRSQEEKKKRESAMRSRFFSLFRRIWSKDPQPLSLADAEAKYGLSAVAIEANYGKYASRHRSLCGSKGSGVIISKTGQVATCAHVVAQLIVDNKRLVAYLSKCIIRFRDHTELMRASVTRVDFGCDLAILQIDDCSGNDFPCSTLAGDVKRGEAVFTVGSPLGYYHSVVPGHIRFVDRRIHHVHFPLASDILLLEHSMPIHHGNSGGPIYNYRGSMVGLVSFQAEEEVRGELEIDKGTVVPIYVPILLYSLGFGIPSRYIRALLESPLNSSKVVQKVDAIFEAEESLPQDGNGGNQAFKQGATTSVDPEASKDNVKVEEEKLLGREEKEKK